MIIFQAWQEVFSIRSNFSHEIHSPHVAFRFISFTGKIQFIFNYKVNILWFVKTDNKLGLFIKYSDKVKNKSIPQKWKKLDVLFILISLLSKFIPNPEAEVICTKGANLKYKDLDLKVSKRIQWWFKRVWSGLSYSEEIRDQIDQVHHQPKIPVKKRF